MWNKEFLESGWFADEVEKGKILALNRCTSRQVNKFFDTWGGISSQERFSLIIDDLFANIEYAEKEEFNKDDISTMRDEVGFWIGLKDLLSALAVDASEFQRLLRDRREAEKEEENKAKAA